MAPIASYQHSNSYVALYEVLDQKYLEPQE